MTDAQRLRCGGHVKSTGQPCKKWAMKGCNPAKPVCNKHGGSSPQVKAKARERIAQADVTRTLARLDVAPVDNPLTALSQLAGEIVAFKDELGRRLNQLHSLRYEDAKGGEQLRSEVALYERALDRTVQVLATIARLNIDERLAKINAEQAELMKQILTGGMTDAGLPTEQRTEVLGHVARRLRLVAG